MRKFIIVLSLVLAAGCATAPPTRFFTLDMRASGNVGDSVALDGGRIFVAQPLSGREMLIQTSPTEVEYYAAAEWVAGLDEIVAEKLAVEFAAGEGAAQRIEYQAVIQHFEQVEASGSVEAYAAIHIEADVSEGNELVSVLNKLYTARVPIEAGSGLRGLAEGLSRCVEEIAVQFVSDVAEM